MKTREEVEELKRQWRFDPIWDIYDTEGFEDYRDELKAYQEQVEQECEQRRQKELDEEKAEAEKLGLHGLFARIKALEELEKRHYKAIEYLADSKADSAYQALMGNPEYF